MNACIGAIQEALKANAATHPRLREQGRHRQPPPAQRQADAASAARIAPGRPTSPVRRAAAAALRPLTLPPPALGRPRRAALGSGCVSSAVRALVPRHSLSLAQQQLQQHRQAVELRGRE
jgi:hypothetical protein